MRVRDVMTASVVTAPPAATAAAVAGLMRDHDVGSVVLADEAGRPVGIVTDRDLALSVVAAGADGGDAAAEHASVPVVTGTPDLALEEAAELMIRHGVRRLPIAEGDRLVGIVTLDDLAARTGDASLAAGMMGEITRAALPDLHFLEQRGG